MEKKDIPIRTIDDLRINIGRFKADNHDITPTWIQDTWNRISEAIGNGFNCTYIDGMFCYIMPLPLFDFDK